MCANTESPWCAMNGHGMNINHSIQIHRWKLKIMLGYYPFRWGITTLTSVKWPHSHHSNVLPIETSIHVKVGFCGQHNHCPLSSFPHIHLLTEFAFICWTRQMKRDSNVFIFSRKCSSNTVANNVNTWHFRAIRNIFYSVNPNKSEVKTDKERMVESERV